MKRYFFVLFFVPFHKKDIPRIETNISLQDIIVNIGLSKSQHKFLDNVTFLLQFKSNDLITEYVT